jgi:hypothetical protein
LYFLLRNTGFGRQVVCYFEKWSIEIQKKRVVKERKEMEDKIGKTKPAIAKCNELRIFKGGNQEQSFTYLLGTNDGFVTIDYNMFEIPDRMEVIFNGELVAETLDNKLRPEYAELAKYGFADDTGRLSFYYKYNPKTLNEMTIRVIPNQQMPTTEWKFFVKCP